MSKKKVAPKAVEEEFLHLSVTKEQITLLASAVEQMRAAEERANLVFNSILAAHGRTAGTLVSWAGGPQPKVTIRI